MAIAIPLIYIVYYMRFLRQYFVFILLASDIEKMVKIDAAEAEIS